MVDTNVESNKRLQATEQLSESSVEIPTCTAAGSWAAGGRNLST